MEYLRESHLGDLLKVVQAIGKLVTTTKEDPDESLIGTIVRGAANRNKKERYERSLTAQASKLVMTFPVLASNTLEPTTAVMISKAVERKCVLMIQMLFAADLKVELANSGGIKTVINQYYNGIDFSTLSVDDMINVVEKISPATYDKYFKETYTAEICKASIKAVMEKCYEDDISESSLNEYYISENNQIRHDETMVVQEARRPRAKVTNDEIFARHGLAKDDVMNTVTSMDDLYTVDKDGKTHVNVTYSDLLALDKNERDRYYQRLDAINKTKEVKIANKRVKLDYEKWEAEKAKNAAEEKRAQSKETREEKIAAAQLKNMEMQLRSSRNDYFKKQLMDSDVKKANELVPAMLIVNYAIDCGPNREALETSAIIGIKTRMVPIDSFEILQKLLSKNKDKSGLLKLIRATTGETKFLKDFVLAVDKAKVDALTKSKKGSVNPIWKVLERRAAISDLRKALGQRNDASPITTLVITQEEVDFLKKESGMNMDDVNTANYILHAYNLMGLVIVDESTETAKFLFDGEFDTFDMLPFNALEREAGDASMYKKVINLMSKRM